MAQKPMNVVVVGGSLGGLFTGVVLKRLGHNVRIFERNPTSLLHNQGAGVVAGGDTQSFFSKYDNTHRPIAVTSRLRHYLDKEGRVIRREDTVQKMTSWDLLYYLLRANFDGVESEYCNVPEKVDGEGNGLYEYGHLVTGLRDGKDHIELDFHGRDGDKETTKADLVVAADGPSSTVRKLFEPEVSREYVGYVAWRGTVPENEASEDAKEAFVEKFAFYHADGIQILSYTIPGENGTLEPGKRLINWVWYCNYPADSQEFSELMTDEDGQRHHNTLPIWKMRKEIWYQQKDYAHKVLPPQFAEIVSNTQRPFIQAITDVLASRNTYFGRKVLLIGDAVAGFRPHTAASTSQAAFDAQLLGKAMGGKMSLEEWEEETMQFARHMQQKGVQMGDRSQFGYHPFAQSLGGVARS
ncbi:MAG: hypothetical protein M1827_003405 [Pycnora praestabilis]|nr:MAG: hypothetical protein M1827_003405 [Pycnora praestabilis]